MEFASRFGANGLFHLELLSEDRGLVFVRGQRERADDGDKNALIVLPTSEEPASVTLDRLVHEYSFKNELDSMWAVRPIELVQERGWTVLVLEDPGGELLSAHVGAPMEIGRFLRMAIGIAAALGKMHQQNLIHKDIKPANILVNTANNEARLTGFGTASRFPRERQSPVPPETIAGTLAYMAPEQTGRMNRSIDSRSDLYSLGVTFYEMLTGSLPFSASDPMEWVHCHIARRPVPPDGRFDTIPAAVSAIVLKLLAKTAEDRYQTAAGVEHDLRRCLAEWETRGRIGDFPLAERDVVAHLLIREKLYGRTGEIAVLLSSFHRVVATGMPELVLVCGYSGIGKSSVVNELHKVLVPPRALFASGKFDQHKRDIPYATVAQAFQSLVRQILSKSEAELQALRDALHEALGPNGRLVVDLIPELELVIGEQPPVADLSPQDAQHRYQMVLRRFIGVFARAEHPLVLFLDDLQWLDVATLDLLEDIFVQRDVRHLLLIGAYRDNEIDPAHPLMRKLDAIRRAGATVHDIVLASLTHGDLDNLIADSLRCETKVASRLVQLVHEKTGGNPFFAIQFLHELADEGLLVFDPGDQRWFCNLGRIYSKRYADNVADLMVVKLNRLPPETQSALRQLACIGSSAELGLLGAASQTSQAELHDTLREAIRSGLVLRSENSYAFQHDRIREAAYSLVPEDARAEAHLWIGRLLLSRTPTEKLDDAIFEIVNQLNRASSLMTAPQERQQLAELNLRAGKRAQASSAYVSALNYLTTGTALLTQDGRQACRELGFALELARARCEFASGAVGEAEKHLRNLSIRTATTAERVAVACLQVDLYQGLDRSDEAIAVGLRALQQLGIDLPERPTKADARGAYDGIWTRLGARAIEDLIHLPLMSDPESLAALDLLIRVAVPGFFNSYHLGAVAVCMAVSLGLEEGHSDASCIAYAQLGTLAGPHFGQFDAGYRFGRLGCELAERPGLQRFQARTFETFGFVVPWTRHVRKGREFLFRGFDLASRIGEISYAGYACGQLNTNYLMAGDTLIEAQKQAELGLAFARKVGFGTIEGWILGQLGLIRSMRGLTNRLGSFDDAAFREDDLERDLAVKPALALSECWYYIRKMQARFLAGEYLDALQAASRAQPMLGGVTETLLEVVEYHFYDALCHAALHESASPNDREHHRATLMGHIEKLDTWALHCPDNFANRAALVGAELARIEGRELDAERLYERAITSACAAGLVQNEALANELAGRFYQARGIERIANAYFREARDCYLRWCADGKVRQLDRLYPHLAATEGQRSAAAVGSAIQHLDAASVVQASQALSSEIELPKLIDRLMTIALENAGADRGLLILPSENEYLIQAEARTTGDHVEVTMRQAATTGIACPESLVRYVIRTKESVILDDASKASLFSEDDYLRDRKSKSILCLPLIKQRDLTGILLLENTLTSHAFTKARIAALKLLAAQAAISLENTRLYGDLREREAKIRRLVDANIIGVLTIDLDGQIIEANDAFLRMVGYDREDLVAGRVRWTNSPPEWRGGDSARLETVKTTGTLRAFEKEYFRKDGSRLPALVGVARIEEDGNKAVAFVIDLTERKQAEAALREAERRNLDAQMQLAHANRIATMGQLTASIAHEINQPIGAALVNAGTTARWLAREPPNLQEARRSNDRIINDVRRVTDIVSRIRDFSKKAPNRGQLEINEAILEVMILTRAAMSEHGVLARMQLSEGLPRILGDRVQLQQVTLNLVMNAIEAMSEVAEGTRELLVCTSRVDPNGVLVTVRDSGPGLPPASLERVFDAFYTTKASGLGMGLSICRSIVEAHGGRLWAEPNEFRGAVFCMMLPFGEKPLGLDDSRSMLA